MTIVVMSQNAKQQIAAGKFKAICLQLMDQVKASGQEIIITKYGKPVAKLSPIILADDTTTESYGYGAMAGLGEVVGDIEAPLNIEWNAEKGIW